MPEAVIEYAKKKEELREVWDGEVPNFNAMVQEIKAHLTRMPPTFRKQLYMWLKKEF